VANPALAYTGKNPYSFLYKGGNTNINGINKTLPNTGPTPIVPATPFLNPQIQRGGSCGCGVPLMKGGSCSTCSLGQSGGACPLCLMGFMVGGKRHRVGCKCKHCRKLRMSQRGGNPGVPYPGGITGHSWTPSTYGWPGVNGVQGDRNHFAHNLYNKGDPQTAMIVNGANPPFSIGGRGTRRRKQRGGTLSNFIAQDFINLGRQVQYGLGSTYNALAGYKAPVNPLPWKGQIANQAM